MEQPCINITPESLRWRTWEKYTPLQRQCKRHFDPKACAQLAKQLFGSSDISYPIPGFGNKPIITTKDYIKISSPSQMSREEASMWIHGFSNSQTPNYGKLEYWLNTTQSKDKHDATYKQLKKSIQKVGGFGERHLYLAAFSLLTLEETVYFLCNALTPDILSPPHSTNVLTNRILFFRDYIWPYLTQDEIELMAHTLETYLGGPAFKSSKPLPDTIVSLAGYLGLKDITQKFVSELKRKDYSYIFQFGIHHETIVDILLCLEDPRLSWSYFKKFGIYLSKEYQFDAWMAISGLDQMQLIHHSIANHRDKKDAERLFHYFCDLAPVPEISPIVLQCMTDTKATAPARHWLQSHSEWSTPFLRKIAESNSKDKTDAVTLLKGIDPEYRKKLEALQPKPYALVKLTSPKEEKKNNKPEKPILPHGYAPPEYPLINRAQTWVTYGENLLQLEFPPSNKFDVEHALQAFNSSSNQVGRLKTSEECGLEEANFIVHGIIALVKAKHANPTHRTPRATLDKEDLSAPPSLEEIIAAYSETEIWLVGPIPHLLLKLYQDPSKIIRSFLETKFHHHPRTIAKHFRYHFIPFLTRKQYTDCQKVIRGFWNKKWVGTLTYLIGSAFGLHQECQNMLEENAKLKGDYKLCFLESYGLDLIFGLGSAKDVNKALKKFKPVIDEDEPISALMVHLGEDGAQYLESAITQMQYKEHTENLFNDHLNKFYSTSLAKVLFKHIDKQRFVHLIRHWMAEHPMESISTLICLAASSDSQSQPAQQMLRKLGKLGKKETILELAALHGSNVYQWIEKNICSDYAALMESHQLSTAPDWFEDALADAFLNKKSDLPPSILTDLLPPLTLGKRCLNPTQIEGLLRALKLSTLSKPHPAVTMVNECAKPQDRGEFAWAVFQQWLRDGGDTEEKWALIAIGLLGDDDCVMKLTPLIKNWPGEGFHPRASLGLECLRTIGTDTALIQIHGISQTAKSKGIKALAHESMESIATELELTRDELDDRIVPDCGLNENGECLFDYGSRKFSFLLSSDLKPKVRDESGSIKNNLPKPVKSDDPEKADKAVVQWKMLKKKLRETTKTQVSRLEQSLISGRRWTIQDFKKLIIPHPLLIHFTRTLLWGAYKADGTFINAFRLTEDRTLADINDEETNLTEETFIGLVHPLELDNETKQRWGELFADYELTPPFAQLERTVYHLSEKEQKRQTLDRWKNQKVNVQKFIRPMESLGWIHEGAQSKSYVHCHFKAFQSAQVTALVIYDGYAIVDIQEDHEMNIDNISFIEGIYHRDDLFHDKKKLILATVNPIVLSEVISDLQSTIKKAKL